MFFVQSSTSIGANPGRSSFHCSSSLPIDQLSSHPKFQNLCSKLKDIRHQLTEADLIDLLNFTHSLGLPNHEKKMYIMLLKLVNHCQLKDLDPNRIRDLYLMTRSNKKYHSLSATARNMRTAASKILGKFKSALAERTDNPQKLESDVYENFEFPQTMESEIIMDTIKAVIANLEKRQNHEMTPTEAYNLVIGCGSLDKFPFEHRDLWEKALHVVIEHLYSTDVQDSDNVIAVVTKLYLKYPKLRCNLFLQLIADRAMQGIIQTPLNSFQLMDQFDKLVRESQAKSAQQHKPISTQMPQCFISIFRISVAYLCSVPCRPELCNINCVGTMSVPANSSRLSNAAHEPIIDQQIWMRCSRLNI